MKNQFLLYVGTHLYGRLGYFRPSAGRRSLSPLHVVSDDRRPAVAHGRGPDEFYVFLVHLDGFGLTGSPGNICRRVIVRSSSSFRYQQQKKKKKKIPNIRTELVLRDYRFGRSQRFGQPLQVFRPNTELVSSPFYESRHCRVSERGIYVRHRRYPTAPVR